MEDFYTLIHYFIPEDDETESEFNTFGVAKELNKIKLKDIRALFPLPGRYLFRFKTKIHKKIVFKDLIDPKDYLPDFEGQIIMKVTRLSWKVLKKSDTREDPEIFYMRY